jgi:hypothetical protein
MRSKDFLASIARKTKQEQADLILPELTRVKADLKAWTARHEMGENGDPDWYRNAMLAAKMMGIRYNTLLREISEERKAARAENGRAYEQAFIAAARRRLDPKVYEALIQEARETMRPEAKPPSCSAPKSAADLTEKRSTTKE